MENNTQPFARTINIHSMIVDNNDAPWIDGTDLDTSKYAINDGNIDTTMDMIADCIERDINTVFVRAQPDDYSITYVITPIYNEVAVAA